MSKLARGDEPKVNQVQIKFKVQMAKKISYILKSENLSLTLSNFIGYAFSHLSLI
jgi:hypothetical protein